MHRILMHIGWFNIYSYGAILALAFIAGTGLACVRAGKQGVEKDKIIDLSFYIVISSILGSRLMFVALNWGYYQGNLLDIVKLWEGGLVFYGGLIAAFGIVIIFLSKNKFPVFKILDIFALPLALGIAIGRIGCFFNGCCYGKIVQRFGISYPALDNPPVFSQQVTDGLISADAQCSLPVIPTQLYLSAACILILMIIMVFERRKYFSGFSFWFFILLYSFTRFIIEGYRYYQTNFMFGGLSISQLISAVLVVVALLAIVRGFIMQRKNSAR